MQSHLIKAAVITTLLSSTVYISEIQASEYPLGKVYTELNDRDIYFGISQFHSAEVKRNFSVRPFLSNDSIFSGTYKNGQFKNVEVSELVRSGAAFTFGEGFYADVYVTNLIWGGFGANLQYQFYGDYRQASKPGNISMSLALGSRFIADIWNSSTSNTNNNISLITGYRLTENLQSNFSVSYQKGKNTVDSCDDFTDCKDLSGSNVILTLNTDYKISRRWSTRVGISHSLNSWYEVDNGQTSANLEFSLNF